jgi:hypothetical protein
VRFWKILVRTRATLSTGLLQPRLQEGSAEVFLEGGAGKLPRTKIVDYTRDKPVLPTTGRFGFTAATGGATLFLDIYSVSVVSPAET